MSMFGPREGSWSLYSAQDPRWNCHGRAHISVSYGVCDEAREKIEQLKAVLGDPPGDLEYSCMKD